MSFLRSRSTSKRPFIFRLILSILGVMIIVALTCGYLLYKYIYAPNVDTGPAEFTILYIPTGSGYQDVVDSLNRKSVLMNQRTFKWIAEKKRYPELVKPGRYLIPDGISNDRLINMLRSGDQKPVNVTFNNIRTREQLAKIISAQLEADSAGIAGLLDDESYLSSFGLDRPNALTLFIPNTYEFWWNTSPSQFVERMKLESDRFWNQERKDKAAGAGLSIPQVITLASIVDKETNKNDEKDKIAGVYMNRLRKGWPLQADPTLVYASGDFALTRVLNIHKKLDSPYNTYKYKGLPPGPICIPSIASIDAVLNYARHDYMFFVANADQSGYHVFSKSLREHNRHAKRYREALKASGKNS